MHQLDVVTAFLYGLLDTTIYMKAPLELISRCTYHIQGEGSTSTSLPNTTHKPQEGERTFSP
jgi:hypothetical protein